MPSDGPTIRVLLFKADPKRTLSVDVHGPFQVLDRGENTLMRSDRGSESRVSASKSGQLSWNGDSLLTAWMEIAPEHDGAIAIDDSRYRGRLRFIATEGGGIAVINVLPLESYLAGVIRGEIPRRFAGPAQRAMAIAARTYALFQIAAMPPDADYHVYCGERSQVYAGISGEDDDAHAAVNLTRGVALATGGDDDRRIFESFYCSTCGGTTISAEAFSGKPAVGPLAGGVDCPCKVDGRSPFVTWPEARLSRADLTRRLTRRYPSLASLGTIANIEPTGDADAGVWTTLTLTGDNGRSRVLRSEELRVGLGDPRIKSPVFTVKLVGDLFVFANGRGLGHSVGLCQFGADALARAGKCTSQILMHYYPGANLVRVY